MSSKNVSLSGTTPRLLDSVLVSKLLDMDAGTLAQWRYLGRFTNELPWIKIGRNVRYRESDVLSFINNSQTVCTGTGGSK
jgi:hypothetical protein